jgi:CHAT domain-containing protein/tetratricopeptide (TPR) repeat protein
MNRNIPLLVVVGLLGAVALWHSRHIAEANPMNQLARAHVGRAFTPRLSIPTEYRPCTSPPLKAEETVPRATCGGDDDAALDLNAFASAAESLDPDSLEASALVQVIWGDEKEPVLDEAITRLEKAFRLTERPVPVLVDLSAAHLARAERTQNSQDLVHGLSYALDALKHEPRNEAALFNAALALDLIALDGEAAKAWGRFLAVDSTSRWAHEARQRREVLLRLPPKLHKPTPGASTAEVDSFAAQHPQEARLLGWETELAQWGAAVLRRDTADAAAHLDLAERLGNALERRRGDLSLAEAARAIRASSSNPAATRTLARAHRTYAAGQQLFLMMDHKAAKDSLRWVVNSRAASSVLLQWAVISLAGAGVYLEPGGADAVTRDLVTRVDSVRYPAMAARVRWTRGTWLLRQQGNAPEARRQYRAAARIYERLGETEFQGAVLGFDGDAADRQGATTAAYHALHQALLMLRHNRSSVWLHNTLLTLANRVANDGMQRAATPIHDEDVVVGLRTRMPAAAAEALTGRAHMMAVMGEIAVAGRDLRAAAPLFGQLRPGRARDWVQAEMRFAQPFVTPRTGANSTAELDSAIVFFKEYSVALVPPLLMLRADARLARDDVAGATADLDTVTARIRGLSREDADPLVRAGLIEEARSRFDQLVMLHVRAGRPIEGLRILERSRVSFAPQSDSAASADRYALSAPPGQVAVEYALIGDTLLIWTIRDRDVLLRGLIVNRGEFLRTVERVGAALETPARAATIGPELQRLYRWLVRPVEGRLGRGETPLVILADGEVAGVPFAALYDVRQAKYLIEDHSLRFASSLPDASRPAPARTAPDSALLVANPAFDRAYYPGLDPLAGARAEVKALEGLYPRHDLLVESGATRAAFVERAQRASVIHYAGHAVFDDARPERSYLVLAGDSTSGQLAADTMRLLKLGGVRLVVLSACQTLRTREGRSGGFAGLSGALLAAGAGGVVGSVWNVDDRLAQPLMVAFHRELRSRTPAEALRQAQRQQLRSQDPKRNSPAAWAGFRYAGR